MIASTSRDTLCGFSFYLLFMVIIAIPFFWPVELGLVLDPIFGMGLLLLVLSFVIIFYLYYTNGGSSRKVGFSFGLLLIMVAAIMNAVFDQIASNNDFWAQHFPRSYRDFFYWFRFFTTRVKDLISLGIAAIGANVAASAILECKKQQA